MVLWLDKVLAFVWEFVLRPPQLGLQSSKMKAKVNGRTYNTDTAENISNYPSPDGDDCLYRTRRGEFFLVQQRTFVDGKRLEPWQSASEIDCELSAGTCTKWCPETRAQKEQRVRVEREIVPLSKRAALVWCVKTQIPECLRGCVLDCI